MPHHGQPKALGNTSNKQNKQAFNNKNWGKKKKGLYRVTVRRTSLMLHTQHRENQIVQHIGKEIGHSQYSNQQQKQVWVLFQKGAVEHMYTILISPPMTSCYQSNHSGYSVICSSPNSRHFAVLRSPFSLHNFSAAELSPNATPHRHRPTMDRITLLCLNQSANQMLRLASDQTMQAAHITILEG